MKTFIEFTEDSISVIDINFSLILEDSTSASTATSGVANPDAKPIIKSKFMGHPCVEVDDELYSACITGKRPFERWVKTIKDDENLRSELKSLYQKHNKVLIRNSKSGGMVFLK